jgi:hypothetical protein
MGEANDQDAAQDTYRLPALPPADPYGKASRENHATTTGKPDALKDAYPVWAGGHWKRTFGYLASGLPVLLASRWLDRPAIGLTLLSDGQQLVILVRDFNPGIPVPRHASAKEESGRGLMLVEAISDRFGWERPADGTPGKIVWAVLLLSAGHSDRDHPVDQMREGTPAEMTSPPRDSYTARWRAAGRQEARELAPGWLASSSALPSRLVQGGVRAAAWVPADGVNAAPGQGSPGQAVTSDVIS